MFLDRLMIHLKPLEKTYSFTVWSDRKLKAGQKWKERIEAEIVNAASQKVDRTALLQTMGQMSCTGAQWCDYVHYDSRWPKNLQFHIQRVVRDEVIIAEIETGVKLFLEELEERMDLLSKRS